MSDIERIIEFKRRIKKGIIFQLIQNRRRKRIIE
jgi:hypothetical protein